MIRAVLDSNVLISSLFWKGLPRHIVDLAIAQHFENITCLILFQKSNPSFMKTFQIFLIQE